MTTETTHHLGIKVVESTDCNDMHSSHGTENDQTPCRHATLCGEEVAKWQRSWTIFFKTYQVIIHLSETTEGLVLNPKGPTV